MKLLILFIFLKCISIANYAQLPSGNWHAALKINDTLNLPFTFSTSGDSLVFSNGDEKISAEKIYKHGDSVIIRMPVFDSEFHVKLTDNFLNGYFYNYSRRNKNIIPFHAERGLSYRFSDKPERTRVNITGRYHIVFENETDDAKNAVGILKQDGNWLTGTFLTTTGDHRFLEGEVSGNRLRLSAFDGFHLFLYTATVAGDSLIAGHYYSGMHWHDTWHGWRDEHAVLSSPDSLTFLKPGFEIFDFTFPDENGNLVSLSDARFKDKSVIVQIMGSWCSNCMDETIFLSKWYNERSRKNVEIIALDFERITDSSSVKKNIRRLKEKFNIQYTVLYAGSADKKEASKALPMLNRVFAFPTTIFLNADKKPVKIHTGFNGPATGEEHEKFKKWFYKFVDEL